MKKKCIGLIGAGCIGNYHSMGYSRVRQVFGGKIVPDFIIAADLDEERAKAACDKYGYRIHTTDWHDVINNPDVDLVLVAVPNYLHAEVVIAAANAGKHVMCEKPMAMSKGEGEAMVRAVTDNRVKNLVNFTYTKLPVTAFVKQLIEKGEIGEITTFRGAFDCDYCVDPNTPSTWRQYAKYAGTGALGDLTAHMISLSDMLVGSEIDEVMACSEIVYSQRPKKYNSEEMVEVDTDDQIYIIVKYKNGHIGTMSSSRIAAGNPANASYEIQGSKGSVVFTLKRMNEINLFIDGEAADRYGFKNIKGNPMHGDYGLQTAYPEAGIGYADIFTSQAHHMLQAIVEDRPVEIDIPYAYKVDQVMRAMAKSAEERRWVKVREV